MATRTKPCECCGQTMEYRHPARQYCNSCRADRVRDFARNAQRAKRQAPPTQPAIPPVAPADATLVLAWSLTLAEIALRDAVDTAISQYRLAMMLRS